MNKQYVEVGTKIGKANLMESKMTVATSLHSKGSRKCFC